MLFFHFLPLAAFASCSVLNDPRRSCNFKPRAQLMKYLIAPQAPSPSRCCRGRSCSGMSTTSTRICPSGRADAHRHASRFRPQLSHRASLILCASGYRTASSYSAGGKCTTPNRSSTVSKAGGSARVLRSVTLLHPKVGGAHK